MLKLCKAGSVQDVAFWAAQVGIKDRTLVITGKPVLEDTFPDSKDPALKRQKLYRRQERHQGSFICEVQLPADAWIQAGTTRVRVKEGVLEVTVDKTWGPQADDIDEIDIHFE